MQANDLAAWAERAYATYVSWGYTPPLDDGDGRTDFYVTAMLEKSPGEAPSRTARSRSPARRTRR